MNLLKRFVTVTLIYCLSGRKILSTLRHNGHEGRRRCPSAPCVRAEPCIMCVRVCVGGSRLSIKVFLLRARRRFDMVGKQK